MGDNRLVITTESKTFLLDLLKDVDINLKHEIYSIIKDNKLLAKRTIKNEIRHFLVKYKHENDIHKNGKQQIEWITQIVNFSQRLDLKR